MPSQFPNVEPLEDALTDILQKALTIHTADGEKNSLQLEIEPLLKKSELTDNDLHRAAELLDLRAEALFALRDGSSHPGPLTIPEGCTPITTDYFAMRVNCYLFQSPNTPDTTLFDTGTDPQPIANSLAKTSSRLAEILITHAHGDHIAICEELCQTHHCPATGYDFHIPPGKKIPPDQPLESACGSLRMHHLPGHAPDALTFSFTLDDIPCLIAGDTLFSCSAGGIRELHRKALAALRKFYSNLPDETLIFPGHGPLTTAGHEKKYNPFL